MSKVGKKEIQKIPLNEREEAFNAKVKEQIIDPLKAVQGTIEHSFKVHTLDDLVSNSKSVYGASAANKTDVNKLVSLIGAAIKELTKYCIEEEASKKDSGYAAMVYMNPEIAPMVGLREGTDLWPTGEYPLLSVGILTAWTAIYVFLNDLKNKDEGKKKLFRCDAHMRRFIGRFHGADSGKDAKGRQLAPFNLDEIDFPRLQKIFKQYIIRGKDGKAMHVNLPENSPRVRAYNELNRFYVELKAQKESLKKVEGKIVHAQKDLNKARSDANAGVVPPEFVQKSEALLQKAQQDYHQASTNFVQAAADMGIVKQE